YRFWTPSVRQDAAADAIPDNIGDRYRYFMGRSMENIRQYPGFYLRNLGASLWEYANTFSHRSRKSPRYAEVNSPARETQRVLLVSLTLLTLIAWLLRKEPVLARSSLLFVVVSFSILLLYRIFPVWLEFLPI